jgi:hypothetical protein
MLSKWIACRDIDFLTRALGIFIACFYILGSFRIVMCYYKHWSLFHSLFKKTYLQTQFNIEIVSNCKTMQQCCELFAIIASGTELHLCLIGLMYHKTLHFQFGVKVMLKA